jgi:ribosomal protein S18 acetylase RimI-like enzyme
LVRHHTRRFRGQGLGRQLVSTIIRAAREKGFEKIELEVFASNTGAVGLYEAAGFVREGRRVRARKLDGVHDDILLYGLTL